MIRSDNFFAIANCPWSTFAISSHCRSWPWLWTCTKWHFATVPYEPSNGDVIYARDYFIEEWRLSLCERLDNSCIHEEDNSLAKTHKSFRPSLKSAHVRAQTRWELVLKATWRPILVLAILGLGQNMFHLSNANRRPRKNVCFLLQPSGVMSITLTGVTELAIFLLTTPTLRAFMKLSNPSLETMRYRPITGSTPGEATTPATSETASEPASEVAFLSSRASLSSVKPSGT